MNLFCCSFVSFLKDTNSPEPTFRSEPIEPLPMPCMDETVVWKRYNLECETDGNLAIALKNLLRGLNVFKIKPKKDTKKGSSLV